LKPEGYYTTVAIPAKINDKLPYLKAYDYGGIGAAVDLVFIMAYDFHEATSLPGPIAPIKQVRQTIEYALKHMKANKIILGVQRYGYDWKMRDSTVIDAHAVSVGMAIETAMKHQVPIQYSKEYQQPFYQYRDETGKKHIVWYEDSRARAQKLKLVTDYHLKGIGEWQLAFQFAQSYLLVSEFLNTQKVL
jgi:spore germination protein YaaH